MAVEPAGGHALRTRLYEVAASKSWSHQQLLRRLASGASSGSPWPICHEETTSCARHATSLKRQVNQLGLSGKPFTALTDNGGLVEVEIRDVIVVFLIARYQRQVVSDGGAGDYQVEGKVCDGSLSAAKIATNLCCLSGNAAGKRKDFG